MFWPKKSTGLNLLQLQKPTAFTAKRLIGPTTKVLRIPISKMSPRATHCIDICANVSCSNLERLDRYVKALQPLESHEAE